MLEASNVYLPLDAALPSCAGMAQAELAHALGIRYADITSWKFSKLSVDARRKNDVHFTASFVFEVADPEIEEALAGKRTKTKIQVKRHVPYEGYRVGEWLGGDGRPIVVGMGPAGLFAAWALAKSGAAPIVLERGEDVDARMASVDAFKEGGALNPESNVQFGEGGAGTFSDGKLTTNIKNPRCRDVLHIFAQAGAPEEILWEGKPHIGTDKLVDVVKTMREQIIAWGGEVRFGARFEGMEFEGGRIVAVRGSQRQEDGTREKFVLPARDVVLACGHSARDVFDRVRNAGLLMERKPFAVGVRIEHPQKLIDKAQYGNAAGHPALGAADYKMAVHLRNDRSVYTFCMCPGGTVVCAASEEDGFSVLRYQQVLLVAEGVAGIVPADLFAQRGVRLAQELVRPDAGEERQLLVELRHALGHHEAVSVLVQLGIETDEGAFRRRHDIVITEGLLLKIDLRGAVAPQEGQQAAAVVVVRVGEKGDIDLCEVDAERPGVFPEGVARAGVKEDLVLFRFDVERKPVLAAERIAGGLVFQ